MADIFMRLLGKKHEANGLVVTALFMMIYDSVFKLITPLLTRNTISISALKVTPRNPSIIYSY